MRLRTFTAPDMGRAMLMIRETLGEDAVIISTARDAGGKSVSVTAALDEEIAEENAVAASSGWHEDYDDEEPVGGIAQYLAATARAQGKAPHAAHGKGASAQPLAKDKKSSSAVLQNRDHAYFLHELEQLLHFHSVPHVLFEALMRLGRDLDIKLESSPRGVAYGLTEVLTRHFTFKPLLLDEPVNSERIMLVGPAGVGKTLAIAKICAHRIADKMPVSVLTIDNKRAGGVEQLQAFTEIMGLEVGVASGRSELRQALKESKLGVPLVIDSFGTNPYSFAELKELTDFANLNGIEPVLVLAAGMNADEAADTVRAFSFLGLKRLIVTRIDSTRRLGAILAAADAGKIALADMTVSAQVAGGLEAVNPAKLAQVLIQHKQDYQG
ncbi:MAG: hypothetical protein FJX23_04255 [Alphaproteobacteria bacterium]|nr:hypothetical protein [Alphaproteobacteria bacterium]